MPHDLVEYLIMLREILLDPAPFDADFYLGHDLAIGLVPAPAPAVAKIVLTLGQFLHSKYHWTGGSGLMVTP